MTLTVKQAVEYIDKLKQQEISLGRPPETWYTYENHVFGTAEIASLIASRLKNMDPQRVYIMALLHDISRIEEERCYRFHGILGYEKLYREDKDAARSCLLHTFPWNKLRPYEEYSGLFYGKKEDYDFIADFIAENKPQDEDYLLQLCDNLANKDGFVTLEQRAAEIARRRSNFFIEDIVVESKEIMKYFEQKIGCNIYEFIKNNLNKKIF